MTSFIRVPRPQNQVMVWTCYGLITDSLKGSISLTHPNPLPQELKIQVSFPFQVFFFGLCVLLVLLCKIKDNLTRNSGKKKTIKKIEVNFLILVEQKMRAIFVLFCFCYKLSWKSFLYGVYWNLMVLFLKFWGKPYVLDGCVLGFEINFKILECEVFNLYFVLQIDVNLEFKLM